MQSIARYIFLPFLILSLQSKAQTTALLGQINTYHQVIDAGCNYITVQSIGSIKAGDRVLIIQMRGGISDSTNTQYYGVPHQIANAGNHEFGTVSSVIGNNIYLIYPLKGIYDVRYKVQLVKVPVYEKARVVSKVYAQTWNGTTGGIVAFEVKDSLYIEADIDVTGQGFRGGASGGITCNCTNSGEYASALSMNIGGFKGEGIFQITVPKNAGVSPNINGGGGGNCMNAGGGGGSNGARGGRGGNSSNECIPENTGPAGRGGSAVSVQNYNYRAFMGGGGGGGSEDDNPGTGSSGASGGGIIFIKAKVLGARDLAPEGQILANGTTAANSITDGAGGGGGGGTIYLDIETGRDVFIAAIGGKGGDVESGRSLFCYAPGGGGSGGVIRLKPGSFQLVNTKRYVTGGKSGVVNGIESPCDKTTYGAQDGEDGIIENDYTPSENFIDWRTNPSINLGRDTFVCENKLVSYDAGPGNKSVFWNDTIASQTYVALKPQTLSVKVIDSQNCFATDTVVISEKYINLKIGNDTSVCPNSYVFVDGGPGFNDYTWHDGLKGQSRYFPMEGTVILTVTRNDGCVDSDTLEIKNTEKAVYLGNDTIMCYGKGLLLDGGPYYPAYTWSDGTTGRFYFAEETDTVWVKAHSAGQCLISDTVIITFVEGRELNLGKDTFSCTGKPIHLTTGGGFKKYEWSNGSADPDIFVNTPGLYWVKTLDSNQCRSIDSINIEFQPEFADTIFVPIAFTPDNDQLNDHFPMRSMLEVTGFEIKIFNRWGEQVFYSNDGNHTWNGYYNGKPAPEGVYYYKIKYRKCSGRYKNLEGTVSIFR